MAKLTTRQCVVIAKFTIPESDYDEFKTSILSQMDAVQYQGGIWELQYLAIDQPLTDVIRRN